MNWRFVWTWIGPAAIGAAFLLDVALGYRFMFGLETNSSVPRWVEDAKFGSLVEAERDCECSSARVQELTEYLVLLFGDGKLLRLAVEKALLTLGLETKLSDGRASVDVLAKTQNGAKWFGIVVTAMPKGIGRQDCILTRVVDCERLKERDEKTILVANTFKGTPLAQRESKEHFTQPAVDFLAHYPVLMMTAWDLYRMVGDVLEEKRKPEELVELMHTTTGVLDYGNEN